MIGPVSSGKRTADAGKFARIIVQETGSLSVRIWALNFWGRRLPDGTGGRLRARIYRLLGLDVGRGTLVFGPITFAPAKNATKHIRIGSDCFINSHVYLDATAPITIGDGVSIGHHVVVITADHAIGPPQFRAGLLQAKPVTIKDGAWIAAGVTVLPGVTIERGAVVAAGAVVAKDVPANSLVGGIPAKFIRTLPK